MIINSSIVYVHELRIGKRGEGGNEGRKEGGREGGRPPSSTHLPSFITIFTTITIHTQRELSY